MTQFVELLVLGMATGGFYVLSALGLNVVFRVSGIINFATAGMAMIGGYLSYGLADVWGWPQEIALPAAVLAAAAAGVVIFRLAIRPLGDASTLTKVIATLGVYVTIQQGVQILYGGVPRVPRSFLPTTTLHIGTVAIGANSLLILAFSIALTVVLWMVYRFTRFGVATSALAESPRSLAALGWNVDRLRAINWAIGGALCGIAGAGLGPILQLTPGVFSSLLIPVLASAIIGGFRSFPLTLIGGLFVGAVQSEAIRYLTWHSIGQAAPFILIVTFLVLRGRSLPLRDHVTGSHPRVGSGRLSPGRGIAAVVLAALVFSQVDGNIVFGATYTVMIAVLLLSQVVVTGYAGQLSLAQLTIGGVGGIIAANADATWHTGFLLSMVIAVVAIIPISLLVGIPSLRARGVGLAIATLGFAFAINAVVLQDPVWSGGPLGFTIGSPTILGISVDPVTEPWRYLVLCLIVFLLTAVVVANLRRGRVGRRMLAVRSNERAAAAIGIHVGVTKLYAFVVAGVIAAVAGVLLTYINTIPIFSTFDPMTGLTALIGVVLGGVGYIFGPFIGGVASSDGLPNAILAPLTSGISWWNSVLPLVGGVLLIAQLIANPNGALDAMRQGRERRRAKRAARAQARAAAPGAPEEAQREHAPADPPRGTALRRLLASTSPEEQTRRDDVQLRSALAAAARRPNDRRPGTLELREVCVSFGSVVAVDAVSMSVSPGEVVAIIGPNGAGKTTLMDAVTGFVGMTGQVVLDGEDVTGWPAHRRARSGLVRSFQSLELLEDMTVIDNLRCAGDPQDLASLLLDLVHPSRGALTAATAAAVTSLHLEHVLTKVPAEISYAERHLVAVARALASSPSVLMLDEPAAGLAPVERAELVALISLIAHDWGIGVLLVEHDVDLVRRVADRVVALHFGKQICAGTPDEVLSDPEIIRAYLGEADEPDEAPQAAEAVAGRISARGAA